MTDTYGIRDFPTRATNIKLYTLRLKGKACLPYDKPHSETFYMECVNVTDRETGEELGYIQMGMDGRVVVQVGDNRIAIGSEELWEAAKRVIAQG